MIRRLLPIGLLAAILITLLAMPVSAVTEHCPEGWTSKDETGDDGGLILAAGTVFCVKGGTEATGILTADGVTTLGDYLTAAGIAGGESYFAVYPATPTPSPTPSPSASPSGSLPPSPSPSASPSIPPVATLFSVEVCPATSEPVATGQSLIRFEHPILVLLLLNVRIDGELVTLRDVAEANAAEVVVSVGVHDWSISNPADTEVLASGTVNCPECNPTTVSPPPATPPSEQPTPTPPITTPSSPTPEPFLPDTATDR